MVVQLSGAMTLVLPNLFEKLREESERKQVAFGCDRDDKGWGGASMENRLMADGIVRRVLWYPTQAKTGLEWGTRRLLRMKQSQKATGSRGDRYQEPLDWMGRKTQQVPVDFAQAFRYAALRFRGKDCYTWVGCRE
jgi:hypothetical protein